MADSGRVVVLEVVIVHLSANNTVQESLINSCKLLRHVDDR